MNLGQYIQQAEVKEVPLLTLDTHDLANLTPVMLESDYTALLLDIEEKGQLDPMLVYRGKIVDGRHRFKALTQLNFETASIITLPNNTTKVEILDLIKTKETHRHQTPTQKAIYAYKMHTMHKEGAFGQASVKMSIANAAKIYGASTTLVTRVSKLNKLRPDLLDILFSGEKINISAYSKKKMYTDSLLSIIKWIEETKALEEPDITGIHIEESFTDKDYSYMNQVVNSIKKQSEQVRKELAKRINDIVHLTSYDDITTL